MLVKPARLILHRGRLSASICCAIAIMLVFAGCRDKASAPSTAIRPVEFAKTTYPSDEYIKLCQVPWFVGVGAWKEVIRFWEQGIITVAPTGSMGFRVDVFAVKKVARAADGSIAIDVFNFLQNPKIARGEFTIIVGPIKDGECEIEYFGHSEVYQTAMKNSGV